MALYQQLWRSFAPPWFLTAKARYISTFYESLGALLDSEAQRSLDGRLASIVYAGAEPFAAKLADGRRIECQPDALPYHFADRALDDYSTLDVLGKRILLSQWHQLHAERGVFWGVIRHVLPYFADRVAAGYALPQITIVSQTNEGTPAAIWQRMTPAGARSITRVSPSNFDYDGQPAKRTRWWAFVEMAGTGYTQPATWDDFDWDDGTLWDEGGALPMTAQRCADVAAMFLDWRSASDYPDGVVLVWPGFTALNPAGTPTQDADGRWSLPNGVNTWGAPGGVDPGTGKPTRPVGFQWIYDGGGG